MVFNGEIKQCNGGMSLITDFLPKTQVQAFQLPVHISHFLQKCKKGRPCGMDLPFLKTISQVFEVSDIYMFIAEIKSRNNKKAVGMGS